MIGFLKSFLKGEKTPEEQAMFAANELQRKRDVMVVSSDAYGADEEEEGSCGTQQKGCGSCGCG